jgi:ankyrin repeat protein
LYQAAIDRCVDVARLLLEMGANMEAKDKNAGTPLHWTVGEEHVNTVRLLLEKGANIEAKMEREGQLCIWQQGGDILMR